MALATAYEDIEASRKGLSEPCCNITVDICLNSKTRTCFCRDKACLCLAANWMGTCTPAYIIPKLTLVDISIPLPSYSQPTGVKRGALTIIIIIGILVGVGTGIRGLLNSIFTAQQLALGVT